VRPAGARPLGRAGGGGRRQQRGQQVERASVRGSRPRGGRRRRQRVQQAQREQAARRAGRPVHDPQGEQHRALLRQRLHAACAGRAREGRALHRAAGVGRATAALVGQHAQKRRGSRAAGPWLQCDAHGACGDTAAAAPVGGRGCTRAVFALRRARVSCSRETRCEPSTLRGGGAPACAVSRTSTASACAAMFTSCARCAASSRAAASAGAAVAPASPPAAGPAAARGAAPASEALARPSPAPAGAACRRLRAHERDGCAMTPLTQNGGPRLERDPGTCWPAWHRVEI